MQAHVRRFQAAFLESREERSSDGTEGRRGDHRRRSDRHGHGIRALQARLQDAQHRQAPVGRLRPHVELVRDRARALLVVRRSGDGVRGLLLLEGLGGVPRGARRGGARDATCSRAPILLESATGHHDKVLPHYDRLGVPYEEWDTATLEQKAPIFDVHEFWPPSRPSDDDFTAPRTKKLPGAIYTPDSGYVNDPALSSHNLQRAAEARGGAFLYRRKVTEIRQARRARDRRDARRRQRDRRARSSSTSRARTRS